MEYKIETHDPAVSLHDCIADRIIFGEDIIFEFDDGIDIPKQNSHNSTGHDMRTGKAAVVLKKGVYKSGISYLEKDEKAKISAEELETTELEILSFEFDQNTGEIKISADSDRRLYLELVFSAESVEYCWNEFTDTAWFDGYEKESWRVKIFDAGKAMISFNGKVLIRLTAAVVLAFILTWLFGEMFAVCYALFLVLTLLWLPFSLCLNVLGLVFTLVGFEIYADEKRTNIIISLVEHVWNAAALWFWHYIISFEWWR